MKNVYVLFVLVGVCVGGWLWVWILNTDLAEERAAHIQTRTALENAVREGQRWQITATTTLEAAEHQRDLTKACLAREAEAESAAREREAILAPAIIVTRSAEDQQKVVDRATRRALVNRLNRPL